MAKSGLESLTKSLALEYAPFKVRVNTVSPTISETYFLQLKEENDIE